MGSIVAKKRIQITKLFSAPTNPVMLAEWHRRSDWWLNNTANLREWAGNPPMTATVLNIASHLRETPNKYEVTFTVQISDVPYYKGEFREVDYNLVEGLI